MDDSRDWNVFFKKQCWHLKERGRGEEKWAERICRRSWKRTSALFYKPKMWELSSCTMLNTQNILLEIHFMLDCAVLCLNTHFSTVFHCMQQLLFSFSPCHPITLTRWPPWHNIQWKLLSSTLFSGSSIHSTVNNVTFKSVGDSD